MKPLSLCALLILLTADISLLTPHADAQSPAHDATTSPPSDSKQPIIPQINIENMNMYDLVSFLRDTVPTFQAVVVRDPEVPDDYPQLTLHLKNVTTDQLIEVLSQAYPSLEWSSTPGTTIHVLKIHAPADLPTTSLHVYSLTPVVSRLQEGPSRPMGAQNNDLFAGVGGQPTTKVATDEQQKRRAALNNVLSVIKAALAQVPEGNGAVLQVHEETETLIFKGTSPQREAVEQVLQAVGGVNVTLSEVALTNANLAAATASRLTKDVDSQLRKLGEQHAQTIQAQAALQSQLDAELREIDRLRAQVNATHPAATQPQAAPKE